MEPLKTNIWDHEIFSLKPSLNCILFYEQSRTRSRNDENRFLKLNGRAAFHRNLLLRGDSQDGCMRPWPVWRYATQAMKSFMFSFVSLVLPGGKEDPPLCTLCHNKHFEYFIVLVQEMATEANPKRRDLVKENVTSHNWSITKLVYPF